MKGTEDKEEGRWRGRKTRRKGDEGSGRQGGREMRSRRHGGREMMSRRQGGREMRSRRQGGREVERRGGRKRD